MRSKYSDTMQSKPSSTMRSKSSDAVQMKNTESAANISRREQSRQICFLKRIQAHPRTPHFLPCSYAHMINTYRVIFSYTYRVSLLWSRSRQKKKAPKAPEAFIFALLRRRHEAEDTRPKNTSHTLDAKMTFGRKSAETVLPESFVDSYRHGI